MSLSPASTADQILAHLRAQASDANRAGIARYGIRVDDALGISNAVLKPMAKALGRNHARARQLWSSGVREARILALVTDEPAKVTRAQLDEMAAEFASWEVVDEAAHLICSSGLAGELVPAYAADQREFVRRAAFATIATGAVHLKKEPDATFIGWLGLVEEHSTDARNFVRKAVNWALRQTGKRSLAMHAQALATAEKLAASSDKTARWIGKDAVRELADPKTLARLSARKR